MASTASSSSWEWSASLAEQVTSRTSRSRVESTTSIAVTTPPAAEIAVATAPTIPWSGAVCRRMVIEYDDAVTDTHSASRAGSLRASQRLGADCARTRRPAQWWCRFLCFFLFFHVKTAGVGSTFPTASVR